LAGGAGGESEILKATSENPGLCVTLPRQNAHLPFVNSASVSVASLDSKVDYKVEPRKMAGVFVIDTRERKHFPYMREDFCRKARKDWPPRTRSGT